MCVCRVLCVVRKRRRKSFPNAVLFLFARAHNHNHTTPRFFTFSVRGTDKAKMETKINYLLLRTICVYTFRTKKKGLQRTLSTDLYTSRV